MLHALSNFHAFLYGSYTTSSLFMLHNSLPMLQHHIPPFQTVSKYSFLLGYSSFFSFFCIANIE
ncbi:hypothetical protein DXB58_13455 [Bacteroides sp. OM05-10AA]|nr:hypothetical protein DXB58_13455 [Bacteroides sp. OM05-10AA]RGQ65330.1 hypothetical protein DWY87_13870 [Bacteroides sp. AF27-33]